MPPHPKVLHPRAAGAPAGGPPASAGKGWGRGLRADEGCTSIDRQNHRSTHTQLLNAPTTNNTKQILRHALARLGPHLRFFFSSSSSSTLDLNALVRRTAGRSSAELCALVDASARRALGRCPPLPLLEGANGNGNGGSKEVVVMVEEEDWAAAERALGAVAPSAVPTPKVRGGVYVCIYA